MGPCIKSRGNQRDSSESDKYTHTREYARVLYSPGSNLNMKHAPLVQHISFAIEHCLALDTPVLCIFAQGFEG